MKNKNTRSAVPVPEGGDRRKFAGRRIACLVFVLMLLMTAVSGVFAAEESGKTVTVGYWELRGMMGGASEGAVKSGYAYEYMQEIASQAGWKYRYVYADYPELYEMLLQGKIDVLPYVTRTEDRARVMLFPDEAMGAEQLYIGSVKPDKLSTDLHELEGKTVGTVGNAFQNELFTRLINRKGVTCKVAFYSDSESIWQDLKKGAIDYSIESSTLYQSVDLYPVYRLGEDYPFYLAVSQTRADLLSELNAAQRRIAEANPALIETLKTKYLASVPLFRHLPEESLAWIKEHKRIRIGTYDHDEPYAMQDKDGNVIGILPDYFSRMLSFVGVDVPVEWKFYAGKQQATEALFAGEIDCVNPYYRNYDDAERAGLILSATTYRAPMSVLYEGEYTEKTMSVIATPDTRLGATYVRDNYPEAQIVRCENGYDCIEKLIQGRATCVVLHGDTLEEIAATYDRDFNIKTLNVACEVCFAALPKDAPLISAVNKLIPYVTDVEMNAIQNKYNAVVKTRHTPTLGQFLRERPGIMFGAVGIIALIIVSFSIFKVRRERAYARELECSRLLAEEARRQAEAAQSRAEDANKAKTRFLFNMSHDIRTPMNAIMGFTDIAKKSAGDKAKLLDCLNKTQEAGNLLLELINSVLEMSRIEAGKAEPDLSPGKADYTFEGIRSTMQELAKKKDIELSFTLGDIRDRYAYVDIGRMNRVLINVISNAIKYTPEGGRISVRCEQAGRKDDCALYRYTIRDNGIGMSEEFQRNLFDAFAREKSATVSGIQGSGLGLSVTKSFVELMGGTIECESKLGEGTTFVITLPLKIQTDEESATYVEPHTRKIVGTHAETAGEGTKLAGKRILVVEDNEMNREIAAFVLGENGIEVEEADDGTTAVEMLREKGPDHYDAILMDIQMPKLNGYEATKAIRKMYPEAGIPIIALSANAFAEDRAASLAAGMNGHVAKPIDAARLFKVLAENMR